MLSRSPYILGMPKHFSSTFASYNCMKQGDVLSQLLLNFALVGAKETSNDKN